MFTSLGWSQEAAGDGATETVVAVQESPVPVMVAGTPAAFDLTHDLLRPLLIAIVFTIVGLILFGVAIWLIVKLSPFSVRKEIEDDQNIALGLIIGSMIIGIAIVLAASLVG
ncbi:DUF350 domain-containing protein [Lignipirellula cremea]|uniref:DUF350 domain-containing protein n=1 Tax=Lignipirellula cremea TaxID=2528010 RepID=A0A518DZX2_9BACT|nr:DUF350 domain-containing protein [Lignipirellula cremea]QDU97388.1 hypothetical protein Pla8534_52340 [Lignipirellula cremea]